MEYLGLSGEGLFHPLVSEIARDRLALKGTDQDCDGGRVLYGFFDEVDVALVERHELADDNSLLVVHESNDIGCDGV